MTLGEKLRQARTERGLSQKQVAGSFMTRNMLSQLENGQALPSVKTLYYLSDVLGVSISWLLDDGLRFGAAQITESARSEFAQGNYRQCMEQLMEHEQKSEEELLLLCRSALAYAASCFENGDYSTAEDAVQTALSCKGVYITETEHFRALLLLCKCALMKREPAEEHIKLFAENSLWKLLEWEPDLLFAWDALTQNRLEEASACLTKTGSHENGIRDYLRGWLFATCGNIEEAVVCLKRAEMSSTLPHSCRLEVYRLLERYYKEKQNYLQAYRYAVLQRDGA